MPLISVTLCTHNRPRLLERALASVLSQDHKDFEVLVLDDGSQPAAEVPAPADGRVRVLRTPHRGVGAARAEGLNAARGSYVAYCDDDDEWTPNHLSTLLEYLQGHPDVALVYGDSRWLVAGEAPSVPYSMDYDGTLLRGSNYIFAGDVLHRTCAARAAGGFDASLRAHEDWDLWLRMSKVCTFRHVPAVLGVHHWHEGCVSAEKHWEDWDRVHRYAQHGWPREGTAAQHDLIPARTRAVSFDRGTWQPGRRELIWRSVTRSGEGYGSVGRHLLLALERAGVDITMAPTRNQPTPGFERFYKPLDHWGRLGFYCDYRLLPSALPCERLINHTMWESTLVPPEHVDEINRVVALQYVPCRQNLESFRECGVRVPVKVLPYGVDVSQFAYLERGRREAFTIGSFGDFSPREGIDVLLRAFQDEFRPGEPVRLLLKTAGSAAPYQVSDERVSLISGYLNPRELLEFLRRMDAFVLPSRGEGFGLCGLEAMATGLPVVATNWSGPAEYLDAESGYPLSYRLVNVQGLESNCVRYFGRWAEPDYEHLRHLLRWLYEHPDEVAAKGKVAAEQVRRKWTWDRAARQVCDDLDTVAAQ